MVELIPAVLPKSFAELGQSLEFLRGVAPWVQVDLVGAHILTSQSAMPLWEEFDFEFDVMFEHPEREVLHLVDVGAARIIVHARNAGALEALQLLQDKRLPALHAQAWQAGGGDFPIEVGVALRAHDTPEALKDFKNLYDYVQVMGIDHEGRQGEPFDPRALQLVRQLREKFPELIIQVDGGVGGLAGPALRSLGGAGANRLVVGSALMLAQNPKAVYKALYTEANR